MENFHLEKAYEIDGTLVYNAYPVKRILYHERSEYQDILVVELLFGKALVLDGIIQFSTYDESVYHDGLVKPCFEADYRDILILGGGDGGAARALRRLSKGVKVTVIDIDPMVTDIVERFMPEVIDHIFEDRDITLVNDDAYRYVVNSRDNFDYIIGDLTDLRPEYFDGSEVNKLYTREFLEILKTRLKRGGKVIYHVGGLNMDTKLISLFWRRATEVFDIVKAYGVYVPSFLDIWVYLAMGEKDFSVDCDQPPTLELRLCDKEHQHTPICYLKR